MTTGAFTFNGQDLGALHGLILERRRMGLVPKTSDRAVHAPSRPGRHDFGTDLLEREITLECFLNQSTRANLETAIANVAAAFDPTNEASGDRGFKQLIFDTLSDRYFLAKLTGMPTPELMVTTGKVSLTLRCADPFAYALAQSISTTAGAASPATSGVIDVLSIDVGVIDTFFDTPTLALAVGGTYKNEPAIEVTTSAAFSGTVTVSNVTTGETVIWSGALAAGDVLKSDSALFRVYVNGVSSMAGVQPGSVWPRLLPNQTYVVVVSGIPSWNVASLKVTYRNRWI